MIQKAVQGVFFGFIILFFGLSCSNSDISKNEPAVHIEKTKGRYQLIRNGKPFYINGGAASADYLEELKEAGANTARIYDTIGLKKILDKAEALDLAVVVDIPLPKFENDPQYYEDPELFNEMKSRIAPVIQKYKDHPALLYWNLGNELYYPYFFHSTKFFENFNSLIDLIHKEDENHPVSTTTIGANKLRVISITLKSPQLDFISFNSFGVLSRFENKLKPLKPFWDGPHVITEWGVNGPWEATKTSWGAPVEETSTKKAEQIRLRHQNYIAPLKEENSLGSFVFYWGQKNEITPTWYSLFNKNRQKTEAVYELEKVWQGKEKSSFPGPQLNYILLNGKGAKESIVVAPGETMEVSTLLSNIPQPNLVYDWEVRKESWFAYHISEKVPFIKFKRTGKNPIFNAPSRPGPYRVFLELTNGTGYIATANIPFYVLNPEE